MRSGEDGVSASTTGGSEEIAKSRLDVILPTPKARPAVLLEETAIEDDRNESVREIPCC